MIRRYGEPRINGISYKMRPGAYAILPLEQSLLVTHQASPHNEFQLPGGGIDPGESPIAALHREVFEETGWRISPPKLFRIYRRFVFMQDYDKWAEKICRIYIAHPVRRLAPPSEAGHSAHWVPIKSATRVIKSLGDRAALSDYLL
jgi:8-oxo-dGTP diphosphatase